MKTRRANTAAWLVIVVALVWLARAVAPVLARPLVSPTELSNLELWLDADDANTITTSHPVVRWSDKSAQSNHAIQATAALGPEYRAAEINGKAAIRLNGTDNWLYFLTPASLKANAARSIFAVFKGSGVGTHDFAMSSRVTFGNVDNIMKGYILRTSTETAYHHTGKGGAVSSNVLTRGEAALAGWTVGANAANPSNYVNGAWRSLNANDLAQAVDELPNSYTAIGQQGGAYYGFSVGEIVCATGVLSTAARQNLEGYLAHKWGLTNSLSPTHPHKDTPPSWGPADLGAALHLWLDADDADTITVSSSTVSFWLDKSGQNRHAAQATNALVPAYIAAALNGKNAMRFDGTNDFLYFVTPASLKANAAKTIFTVVKGSGLGTSDFVMSTRITLLGTTNAACGYILRTSTDSKHHHTGKGGAVSSNVLTRGEAALAGWTVSANAANPSNYVNGAGRSLNVNNLAKAIDEIGGYTAIGQQDGEYGGCDVGEIVAVSRVLPLDERQKLEGYLARKWGLLNKLPEGHPYKHCNNGSLMLLR